MENKYRGVPIEIDGQALFFYFGFNDLCALENALGTSTSNVTFASVKAQRAFVWAGLQHEKNPPSIEEVGEMLTPYLKDQKRLSEILEAAATAYAHVFPDQPKTEEAEANA
jgi:hypothetical protein